MPGLNVLAYFKSLPTKWHNLSHETSLDDSCTERRRSNSWAFYQLRLFIEYKALVRSVRVIPVSPAYTFTQ
jgi:hypothetical protein